MDYERNDPKPWNSESTRRPFLERNAEAGQAWLGNHVPKAQDAAPSSAISTSGATQAQLLENEKRPSARGHSWHGLSPDHPLLRDSPEEFFFDSVDHAGDPSYYADIDEFANDQWRDPQEEPFDQSEFEVESRSIGPGSSNDAVIDGNMRNASSLNQAGNDHRIPVDPRSIFETIKPKSNSHTGTAPLQDSETDIYAELEAAIAPCYHIVIKLERARAQMGNRAIKRIVAHQDGVNALREMGTASGTRTQTTELAYLKIVQSRIRAGLRRRREDDAPPASLNPQELLDDLIKDQSNLAPNTFLTYRSALLWYFAQWGKIDAPHQSAYQRLCKLEKPAKSRSQKKGSSKPRARTISEADFEAISHQLALMSGWGARTRAWWHAGLASGARPVEWLGAYWEDTGDKETLCLPNAKRKIVNRPAGYLPAGTTVHDLERNAPELFTPGPLLDRAKDFRRVPIHEQDRVWVNAHLESLNGYISDCSSERSPKLAYVAYYDTCRALLNRACCKVFKGKPKRHSLYNCRGQFAANRKAVYPLEEVAAMLGHDSVRTTMSHYGHMKHAHGGAGRDRLVDFERSKPPAQKPERPRAGG